MPGLHQQPEPRATTSALGNSDSPRDAIRLVQVARACLDTAGHWKWSSTTFFALSVFSNSSVLFHHFSISHLSTPPCPLFAYSLDLDLDPVYFSRRGEVSSTRTSSVALSSLPTPAAERASLKPQRGLLRCLWARDEGPHKGDGNGSSGCHPGNLQPAPVSPAPHSGSA